MGLDLSVGTSGRMMRRLKAEASFHRQAGLSVSPRQTVGSSMLSRVVWLNLYSRLESAMALKKA